MRYCQYLYHVPHCAAMSDGVGAGTIVTCKRKEARMGDKLQQGDRFPAFTLKLVQGGAIRLPVEIPTHYAAILVYRGHW